MNLPSKYVACIGSEGDDNGWKIGHSDPQERCRPGVPRAGQVSVLAQQLVHRYRGQAHQDLDFLAEGDDTRCSSQS
jgi:hypothetical protein